jgi:protein TonB
MEAEKVADSPTLSARVRSFLGWALVISAAAHFVIGGLMPYKPFPTATEPVEIVTRDPRHPPIPPTPPPTPTPPPPSKSTPAPVQSSNPPPVHIQPPTIHDNGGNAIGQTRYTPAPGGRDDGVLGGTGTPAPATTSAPATAAPIATPTPRSCAQPHQDATTTQKAEADYPEIARQQGAAGIATVKVNLTASGLVAAANLYKSSGFAALDQEALKAARNSRYSPEVEDCQKVAGQYLFVVDFAAQ